MFNKKKKRIIELENTITILNQDYKVVCNDVNNLKNLLEKTRGKNMELIKVNNAFSKTIEKQAIELETANKKIIELEACFKPQVTMCEENPSTPEKIAKNDTKTVKTEPKKTSKRTKKA